VMLGVVGVQVASGAHLMWSLRAWTNPRDWVAERATWSTELYIAMSAITSAILLWDPSLGVATISKHVLRVVHPLDPAYNVLARTCGVMSIELLLLHILHSKSCAVPLFVARTVLVLTCFASALSFGGVLDSHWRFSNSFDSAKALSSALLFAGPSLLSLPATLADLLLRLSASSAPLAKQQRD
jgi:hypothetical protein